MFSFAKLFRSKPAAVTLHAPVSGEIIDKSAIPDPTFAGGSLGPTIGFYPQEGLIYAPCSGVITQLFSTGHALTLTSAEGIEILIHVGIDTVDLQGQGFAALVKEDAHVETGDALIKFDLQAIKAAGFAVEVPLVICNKKKFTKLTFRDPGPVQHGEIFCTLAQQP